MGKCASKERIGRSLHSKVRKLPASRKQREASGVQEEAEKQPFFVKDRETPVESSVQTSTGRKKEDKDELHEKLISSSVAAEGSGEDISVVPPNLTQDDNLPDFPALHPDETSEKQYHSESRSLSPDAVVTAFKYHEVQSSVAGPRQEVILLSTEIPVQEHSQDSFILPTGNAIKKYSELSEAESSEDRPLMREKENIPTDAVHYSESTLQEEGVSTETKSNATLQEVNDDLDRLSSRKDNSGAVPGRLFHVGKRPDVQAVGRELDMETFQADEKNTEQQLASGFDMDKNTQREGEISSDSASRGLLLRAVDSAFGNIAQDDISSQNDFKAPATDLEVGTTTYARHIEDISSNSKPTEVSNTFVTDTQTKNALENEGKSERDLSVDNEILKHQLASQFQITGSTGREEESSRELPFEEFHSQATDMVVENVSQEQSTCDARHVEEIFSQHHESDLSPKPIDGIIDNSETIVAEVPGLEDKAAALGQVAQSAEGEQSVFAFNGNHEGETDDRQQILQQPSESNIDSKQGNQDAESVELQVEEVKDDPELSQSLENKLCTSISQEQESDLSTIVEPDTDRDIQTVLADVCDSSACETVGSSSATGEFKDSADRDISDLPQQNQENVASSNENIVSEVSESISTLKDESGKDLELNENAIHVSQGASSLEDTVAQDDLPESIEQEQKIPGKEDPLPDSTAREAVIRVDTEDNATDYNQEIKEVQEFVDTQEGTSTDNVLNQDESAIQDATPEMSNVDAAAEIVKLDMISREANTANKADVQILEASEPQAEESSVQGEGEVQIQDASEQDAAESFVQGERNERGTDEPHLLQEDLDVLLKQDGENKTNLDELEKGTENKILKENDENEREISSMAAVEPQEPSLTKEDTSPEFVGQESEEPAEADLPSKDLPESDFVRSPVEEEELNNQGPNDQDLSALQEQDGYDKDGKIEGRQKEDQETKEEAVVELQETGPSDDGFFKAGQAEESVVESETKDSMIDAASLENKGTEDFEGQTIDVQSTQAELEKGIPEFTDKEYAQVDESDSSQGMKSIILEEGASSSEATAVEETPESDKLQDLQSRNLDSLPVLDNLQESSQVPPAPVVNAQLNLQQSVTPSDNSNLEEEQKVGSQDIDINEEGCPPTDLIQDAASELHGAENKEFKEQEAAEHDESEKCEEVNKEFTTVDGKAEIDQQREAGQEGAKEEPQLPSQIQDGTSELDVEVSHDAIDSENFEAPTDNVPESSQDIKSIISEEDSSLSEATPVEEHPEMGPDKLPDYQSSNLDSLPVPDVLQESNQVTSAPEVDTHLDLQESVTTSDVCNLVDEQEVASQDIKINEDGCPQTDLNQDAASESHGMENPEFKEQEAVEHEESENCDEMNRELAATDGKAELAQQTGAGQEGVKGELQPPFEVISEMTAGDIPRQLNVEVSQDEIFPETFEAPTGNVPDSSQEDSGVSEATAVEAPPELEEEKSAELQSSNLDSLPVPDELQETNKVPPAPEVNTQSYLQESMEESDICNREEELEVAGQDININEEGCAQTELNQDTASKLHGVENQDFKEQEAVEHEESENYDGVNREVATADGKEELAQQTATDHEGAKEELQPPPQIQDATSEMTVGDRPTELEVELSQNVIAPENFDAPIANVPDSSQDIISIISEEDLGLSETTLDEEEPLKSDAEKMPDLQSNNLENLPVPDELQESNQAPPAPEANAQLDLQESVTESEIWDRKEEPEVATREINTDEEGYAHTDLNQDAASELHGMENQEFKEQEAVKHEESENHEEVNSEGATAEEKAEIGEQTAAGQEGAKEELQLPPQIQDVTSEMTAGDASTDLNVEVSPDVIAPENFEASTDNVADSSQDRKSTISEEDSGLAEATAVDELPRTDADKLPDFQSSNLGSLPVPDELQESIHVTPAPELNTELDLQKSATASDIGNLDEEQEVATQDINRNEEGCPQTDLNQDAPSQLQGVENQEFKEQDGVEHEENENCDEVNREVTTVEIDQQTGAGEKGAKEELQTPPQIQDGTSEMTKGGPSQELKAEVSEDAITPEISDAPSDNVPDSSEDIRSIISKEHSSLSEATAVEEPPKSDADKLPDLQSSKLDKLPMSDELQESNQVLPALEVDSQLDLQESVAASDICNLAEEAQVTNQDSTINEEGCPCPHKDLNRDAASELHADGKAEIDKLLAAGQEGAKEEPRPPPQIQDVTSEMAAVDPPRELIDEVSQDVIPPENSEAFTDNVPDSSKELKCIISEEDSGLSEATVVEEPPKLEADMLPDLQSNTPDILSVPELAASEGETKLDIQEPAALAADSCSLEEQQEVGSRDININDEGNSGCSQTLFNQDSASDIHLLEGQEFKEQEAVEQMESENRDELNREAATADVKVETAQQRAIVQEDAEEALLPPQIEDVDSEMTAGDAPRELNVEASSDVTAPEVFEAPTDKVPEFPKDVISAEDSSLPESTAVEEPPNFDADILPELQSSTLDNLSVQEELKECSQVLATPEDETLSDLRESGVESNIYNLQEEREVTSQDIDINDEANPECPQTDSNQDAATELLGVENRDIREQEAVEHTEVENCDELNREVATAVGEAEITEQTAAQDGAEDSPDVIASGSFEAPSDNVQGFSQDITSINSEETSGLSGPTAVLEPPKLDADILPHLHSGNADSFPVLDELQGSGQTLAAPEFKTQLDLQESATASDICNTEEETTSPDIDINDQVDREAATADGEVEIAQQTQAGQEGAEEEFQPPTDNQDVTSETAACHAPGEPNVEVSEEEIAPEIYERPSDSMRDLNLDDAIDDNNAATDRIDTVAELRLGDHPEHSTVVAPKKESGEDMHDPPIAEPSSSPMLDFDGADARFDTCTDNLHISQQEPNPVEESHGIDHLTTVSVDQNGEAGKGHEQTSRDTQLLAPSEEMFRTKPEIMEPDKRLPETPITTEEETSSMVD